MGDPSLVADQADEFDADTFCAGCRVCTDACPPGAISPDMDLVRGTHEWYVDFDRCLPYFASTYGGAICLAVCPWSKPGAAPRLAENMLRKRERAQLRERTRGRGRR
jgi:epoxyqueuosine reductase QueG